MCVKFLCLLCLQIYSNPYGIDGNAQSHLFISHSIIAVALPIDIMSWFMWFWPFFSFYRVLQPLLLLLLRLLLLSLLLLLLQSLIEVQLKRRRKKKTNRDWESWHWSKSCNGITINPFVSLRMPQNTAIHIFIWQLCMCDTSWTMHKSFPFI